MSLQWAFEAHMNFFFGLKLEFPFVKFWPSTTFNHMHVMLNEYFNIKMHVVLPNCPNPYINGYLLNCARLLHLNFSIFFYAFFYTQNRINELMWLTTKHITSIINELFHARDHCKKHLFILKNQNSIQAWLGLNGPHHGPQAQPYLFIIFWPSRPASQRGLSPSYIMSWVRPLR